MSEQNPTITFSSHPTDPRFIDLTGRIFGHWKVLGYAGKIPATTQWFCECVCKSIRKVNGTSLRRGQSLSCGCKARRRKRFVHGETYGRKKTPEYLAYGQAKARCENPARKEYARYGGRGIEFRFTSFQQFLADIGRRPTRYHSLDRKDNDGHYEPGNVRWATPDEQQHNIRRNYWLTIDGVSKVIADWSKESGRQYGVIVRRLAKGWCEKCAVFQPPHGSCSHLANDGSPSD
jgi:hypothetical protein